MNNSSQKDLEHQQFQNNVIITEIQQKQQQINQNKKDNQQKNTTSTNIKPQETRYRSPNKIQQKFVDFLSVDQLKKKLLNLEDIVQFFDEQYKPLYNEYLNVKDILIEHQKDTNEKKNRIKKIILDFADPKQVDIEDLKFELKLSSFDQVIDQLNQQYQNAHISIDLKNNSIKEMEEKIKNHSEQQNKIQMAHNQQIADLEESIKQTILKNNEKLKQKDIEIDIANKKNQDSRNQYKQQVDQKLKGIKQEFLNEKNQLLAKIQQNEQTINHLKQQIENQNENIIKLKELNDSYEENLNQEKKIMRQNVEKVQQDERKKQKILQQKVFDTQSKVDNNKKQFKKVQGELYKIQNENKNLLLQNQIYKENIENKEFKCVQQDQQIQNKQKQVLFYEQNIEDLKSSNAQIIQDLNDAQNQIKTKDLELQNRQKKIDNLVEKLEQLEKINLQNQQKIESINLSENLSQNINQILEKPSNFIENSDLEEKLRKYTEEKESIIQNIKHLYENQTEDVYQIKCTILTILQGIEQKSYKEVKFLQREIVNLVKIQEQKFEKILSDQKSTYERENQQLKDQYQKINEQNMENMNKQIQKMQSLQEEQLQNLRITHNNQEEQQRKENQLLESQLIYYKQCVEEACLYLNSLNQQHLDEYEDYTELVNRLTRQNVDLQNVVKEMQQESINSLDDSKEIQYKEISYGKQDQQINAWEAEVQELRKKIDEFKDSKQEFKQLESFQDQNNKKEIDFKQNKEKLKDSYLAQTNQKLQIMENKYNYEIKKLKEDKEINKCQIQELKTELKEKILQVDKLEKICQQNIYEDKKNLQQNFLTSYKNYQKKYQKNIVHLIQKSIDQIKIKKAKRSLHRLSTLNFNNEIAKNQSGQDFNQKIQQLKNQYEQDILNGSKKDQQYEISIDSDESDYFEKEQGIQNDLYLDEKYALEKKIEDQQQFIKKLEKNIADGQEIIRQKQEKIQELKDLLNIEKKEVQIQCNIDGEEQKRKIDKYFQKNQQISKQYEGMVFKKTINLKNKSQREIEDEDLFELESYNQYKEKLKQNKGFQVFMQEQKILYQQLKDKKEEIEQMNVKLEKEEKQWLEQMNYKNPNQQGVSAISLNEQYSRQFQQQQLYKNYLKQQQLHVLRKDFEYQQVSDFLLESLPQTEYFQNLKMEQQNAFYMEQYEFKLFKQTQANIKKNIEIQTEQFGQINKGIQVQDEFFLSYLVESLIKNQSLLDSQMEKQIISDLQFINKRIIQLEKNAKLKDIQVKQARLNQDKKYDFIREKFDQNLNEENQKSKNELQIEKFNVKLQCVPQEENLIESINNLQKTKIEVENQLNEVYSQIQQEQKKLDDINIKIKDQEYKFNRESLQISKNLEELKKNQYDTQKEMDNLEEIKREKMENLRKQIKEKEQEIQDFESESFLDGPLSNREKKIIIIQKYRYQQEINGYKNDIQKKQQLIEEIQKDYQQVQKQMGKIIEFKIKEKEVFYFSEMDNKLSVIDEMKAQMRKMTDTIAQIQSQYRQYKIQKLQQLEENEQRNKVLQLEISKKKMENLEIQGQIRQFNKKKIGQEQSIEKNENQEEIEYYESKIEYLRQQNYNLIENLESLKDNFEQQTELVWEIKGTKYEIVNQLNEKYAQEQNDLSLSQILDNAQTQLESQLEIDYKTEKFEDLKKQKKKNKENKENKEYKENKEIKENDENEEKQGIIQLSEQEQQLIALQDNFMAKMRLLQENYCIPLSRNQNQDFSLRNQLDQNGQNWNKSSQQQDDQQSQFEMTQKYQQKKITEEEIMNFYNESLQNINFNNELQNGQNEAENNNNKKKQKKLQSYNSLFNFSETEFNNVQTQTENSFKDQQIQTVNKEGLKIDQKGNYVKDLLEISEFLNENDQGNEEEDKNQAYKNNMQKKLKEMRQEIQKLNQSLEERDKLARDLNNKIQNLNQEVQLGSQDRQDILDYTEFISKKLKKFEKIGQNEKENLLQRIALFRKNKDKYIQDYLKQEEIEENQKIVSKLQQQKIEKQIQDQQNKMKKEEYKQYEEKIEELQKQIENQESKLKNLKTQINQNKLTLKDKEKEINEFQDQTKKLNENLSELEKKIVTFIKIINFVDEKLGSQNLSQMTSVELDKLLYRVQYKKQQQEKEKNQDQIIQKQEEKNAIYEQKIVNKEKENLEEENKKLRKKIKILEKKNSQQLQKIKAEIKNSNSNNNDIQSSFFENKLIKENLDSSQFSSSKNKKNRENFVKYSRSRSVAGAYQNQNKTQKRENSENNIKLSPILQQKSKSKTIYSDRLKMKQELQNNINISQVSESDSTHRNQNQNFCNWKQKAQQFQEKKLKKIRPQQVNFMSQNNSPVRKKQQQQNSDLQGFQELKNQNDQFLKDLNFQYEKDETFNQLEINGKQPMLQDLFEPNQLKKLSQTQQKFYAKKSNRNTGNKWEKLNEISKTNFLEHIKKDSLEIKGRGTQQNLDKQYKTLTIEDFIQVSNNNSNSNYQSRNQDFSLQMFKKINKLESQQNNNHQSKLYTSYRKRTFSQQNK